MGGRASLLKRNRYRADLPAARLSHRTAGDPSDSGARDPSARHDELLAPAGIQSPDSSLRVQDCMPVMEMQASQRVEGSGRRLPLGPRRAVRLKVLFRPEDFGDLRLRDAPSLPLARNPCADPRKVCKPASIAGCLVVRYLPSARHGTAVGRSARFAGQSNGRSHVGPTTRHGDRFSTVQRPLSAARTAGLVPSPSIAGLAIFPA